MDLNTLRTLYALGDYPSIITGLTTGPNENNPEFLVLGWKSILKATGDVSKCAQFLSAGHVSEILKKCLMLWSKVFKNHGSSSQPPSSSDIAALREIGLQAANEASAEIGQQQQEERDQIILISAEALLMLSATTESFSLLKLLKASNLDCQVLFIEILINFGQFSLAQDRLRKMKNIPEWKDDVRFLLAEALLGLHANDEEFGVMDSLYSYQELIQVHGSTPRLLLHLAAAFILLKKFTEAQSTLLQIPASLETDPIVKANLLVIDALLNSPNFPLSLRCSVACCKVHKETCSGAGAGGATNKDSDALDTSLSSPTSSTATSAAISLNDKLTSSHRLQSFLNSSPYLSSHLPVLLARIDRHDSSSSTVVDSSTHKLALAKELGKKERIAEVLKEAIETDPKVAELYQILLDENII